MARAIRDDMRTFDESGLKFNKATKFIFSKTTFRRAPVSRDSFCAQFHSRIDPACAAQLHSSDSRSRSPPKSSPDSESESADNLLNATPTESPPGSTLSPAGAVSGARVSPGPLPVAQGPCFAACGANRKQPGQGGPEAACQCITGATRRRPWRRGPESGRGRAMRAYAEPGEVPLPVPL